MFPYGLGIAILYLVAAVFSGIAIFNKREYFFRFAGVAAYVAIPVHLAYLIIVGVRERAIPLANFYQAMSVVSFFIALIYVILMYLHLFREIKRSRPSHMYDRLPPLGLLDRLNTTAIVGGFVFLAVGIFLGGALAVSIWNHIPMLDAKILASLVLWGVYVFGLLMLALSKWSGRKMSLVSICGFVVVIVGVVVARLFDSSFHRF